MNLRNLTHGNYYEYLSREIVISGKERRLTAETNPNTMSVGMLGGTCNRIASGRSMSMSRARNNLAVCASTLRGAQSAKGRRPRGISVKGRMMCFLMSGLDCTSGMHREPPNPTNVTRVFCRASERL